MASDLQRELARLRREVERLKRNEEQQEQNNERLEKDNGRLEKDVGRLEKDVGRLEKSKERLRRKHERLKDKLVQLRRALDLARRAGKRQAAPFSKGKPKSKPRRPGRRSGKQHGPATRRKRPKHVDEVVEAPLPKRCPDCNGKVEESRVAEQFQTELPKVRPLVTQFNVHVGRCVDCGRRLQGRHSRQTSDALGAAASQVGPRTLALAADLNKGHGLSFGKLSRLFDEAFGLSITPGGLCLGLHRLARAARPTYDALIRNVRGSPVVSPDETGWKVGGWLQWLWVFVTPQVTVYAVLPGRGFEQAASVLGEDFDGVLVRDGWAPYRKFVKAEHQSCLAHLLRRCRENLETALRGTARLPRGIQRLLKRALKLRERRDAGNLQGHGLAVAVGKLGADTNRLLTWNPTDDDNRKLVQHLRTERNALFTFLLKPGVPATNWPAEQAIRPAVVTRKVCGGNRTWNGAQTQHVLASVLQTCRQQQHDSQELFSSLLCSPTPTVALSLIPDNNDSGGFSPRS